jgi:hypothetical protein
LIRVSRWPQMLREQAKRGATKRIVSLFWSRGPLAIGVRLEMREAEDLNDSVEEVERFAAKVEGLDAKRELAGLLLLALLIANPYIQLKRCSCLFCAGELNAVDIFELNRDGLSAKEDPTCEARGEHLIREGDVRPTTKRDLTAGQ